MASAPVVCFVCRRLHRRITPVELVPEASVKIGLLRVYACPEHRDNVELVTEVAGAAARAGLDMALEKRAPGLKKKFERVLRALRG